MSIRKTILAIDEDRAIEAIEGYLRDLIETRSVDGFLLGLSGGLDSAFLAAMAVRAVGSRRVYGVYLYDRASGAQSKTHVRLLCQRLGLDLEERNIDPIMERQGLYGAGVMALTAWSPLVNRFILAPLCRFILGEAPFVAILHRGRPGYNRLARAFHEHLSIIEHSFNVRHIYRRDFLEKRAAKEKLLLLGAANFTEYATGWFVQGGIDDVEHQPLVGLYKTQVRQLGQWIAVPTEILIQRPSPDMIRGIVDEIALGIDYTSLDLILDGIDQGWSDEKITTFGVERRQIRHVRTIHRRSAWKRKPWTVRPPVDGRVAGGYRRYDCLRSP